MVLLVSNTSLGDLEGVLLGCRSSLGCTRQCKRGGNNEKGTRSILNETVLNETVARTILVIATRTMEEEAHTREVGLVQRSSSVVSSLLDLHVRT